VKIKLMKPYTVLHGKKAPAGRGASAGANTDAGAGLLLALGSHPLDDRGFAIDEDVEALLVSAGAVGRLLVGVPTVTAQCRRGG
jgi:hypothetical protein